MNLARMMCSVCATAPVIMLASRAFDVILVLSREVDKGIILQVLTSKGCTLAALEGLADCAWVLNYAKRLRVLVEASVVS